MSTVAQEVENAALAIVDAILKYKDNLAQITTYVMANATPLGLTRIVERGENANKLIDLAQLVIQKYRPKFKKKFGAWLSIDENRTTLAQRIAMVRLHVQRELKRREAA